MANLKEFLSATVVNGGASYNVVTGQLNPTTGYMVAIAGHERVIENVANIVRQKKGVLKIVVTPWIALLGLTRIR